jgi:hypothetical protein
MRQPLAQVGNRQAQRLCDSKKAEEAGVADAALDAADVGGVKLAEFSEFLLCEAALSAGGAEVAPQSGEGRMATHYDS